jgi:hypothetical protein
MKYDISLILVSYSLYFGIFFHGLKMTPLLSYLYFNILEVNIRDSLSLMRDLPSCGDLPIARIQLIFQS